MKIELKNIGTVKHAEIDLDKNLLIFCGPNNSGKTYVAYTLYGVYKTVPDNLNNTIELKHERTSVIGVITKYEFSLSPQLVRNNFIERAAAACGNLEKIFASNQYFFSESIITINKGMTDEDINEEIKKRFIDNKPYSSRDGNYQICKQTGTNTISIKVINNRLIKERVDNFRPLIDIDEINKDCNLIIKQLFFDNTYIFPAERIAINIFSKEVYLNRAGLLDTPATTKSRYSLPIAASLRVAEDLSFLEKTQSDYATIAKLIEDKILLGSITVSPYGEMQFNPHKADIKGISINLSGSMVKSLSSLVFYFRHLAIKGDFIIIDEPELNLHPDNQIIMARILARIVNEGFKVLISTHSDYIISELNNLVRLHSEKKRAQEIMQKYGYTNDELLDKDSLGVYLFNDNTAKSLEVDELGFGVSTIEKVNSELSQISESIYFDLFDKDDE
jgi:predicted ATPase